MHSAAFLVLSLLSLTMLAPAARAQDRELSRIEDQWSRYGNARYDTMLDIPTALFTMLEPPPANGDGRTFKAQDGAELRVFGSYDSSTITETFTGYKAWMPEEMRESGLKVSYKAQGKDWLVFSGSKGGNIVYVKVLEGCDATHEMRLTYPVAQKALYDPLVARLSRSFKCEPVH